MSDGKIVGTLIVNKHGRVEHDHTPASLNAIYTMNNGKHVKDGEDLLVEIEKTLDRSSSMSTKRCDGEHCGHKHGAYDDPHMLGENNPTPEEANWEWEGGPSLVIPADDSPPFDWEKVQVNPVSDQRPENMSDDERRHNEVSFSGDTHSLV